MNLFSIAKELETKIKKSQMEKPFKELDATQREKIKIEHWEFLDELESILLPASMFSSQEKYDIMTKFQNKIEQKIEAEIYLKEISLNKK